MAHLSAVYILVLLVPLTWSSSGDRSHEFSSCVYSCKSSLCGGEGEDLSLVLRALGWTCGEECQYQCMHNITAEDLRNNRPVRQFYGKVSTTLQGIPHPLSPVYHIQHILLCCICIIVDVITVPEKPLPRAASFRAQQIALSLAGAYIMYVGIIMWPSLILRVVALCACVGYTGASISPLLSTQCSESDSRLHTVQALDSFNISLPFYTATTVNREFM